MLEAFSFLYERQNNFVSYKESRFLKEDPHSETFLNIISNIVCLGMFLSIKLPSFLELQMPAEILRSVLH